MSPTKLARVVALLAGTLDFCTGLGLVFAPKLLLPLMRVTTPGEDALIYLRFVGAFVAAVGGSYLWALVRGGTERLRSTLELTIIFRLLAGGYSSAAIVMGWLPIAWSSVPLTDFTLVCLQFWLVKKLSSHDGHPPSSRSA
ncbi:MAG: hypothetical protein QM790_14205 [Nibricoccus sp.]